MSMEADIAEMKADLKHVVALAMRHDKSLYGEDGGNGLVGDCRTLKDSEAKRTRLMNAVTGLLLANVAVIGKTIVSWIRGN